MTGAPDAGQTEAAQNILVIRLGALGDFVLSMGPFAAIREHHKSARITLLTTTPYEALADASGYFDEIWIDDRPKWWQIDKVQELQRRLRDGNFARVYDLQTSDRSSIYFKLFGRGRRPEWSGIASGCSHPDDNPNRRSIHTIERQAEQLRRAGIETVPPPDLSWIDSDSGVAAPIRQPYILLVPGGAPHRPAKRWPAKRYATLAQRIADLRATPVVIGGPPEADMAAAICQAAPNAIDLTGETSFADIVVLARDAELAVGNDTGPMHLIASAGCRTIVLFSNESDPVRTAPRAPDGAPPVKILRQSDLASLSVDQVWGIVRKIIEDAAEARRL